MANTQPTPEFTKDDYKSTNENDEFFNNFINDDPEDSTEITGEDLLNRPIIEIPKLVDPIFPKSGLVGLAGASDLGKSMILRQLAVDVVTGASSFLGFPLKPQHRSVIYVATEDDESNTIFCLRKQSKYFAPEDLKGLRFVFDYENLIQELDARLTRNPADLVVIDCFGDAFGQDLKETHKIRVFLKSFQALAKTHECLFMFLHHTAKRTEYNQPSKNNLLSGQGFEAKLRLVIELKADNLIPSKRHLCIVKGNYLPSEYKRESFVLDFYDDSFRFTNSGERTPFELLSQKSDPDEGKAQYEQAKQMKAEGLTYEQIAFKIGFASKGSVTKLFTKAKQKGWDNSVSIGNEGND